MSSVYVPAKDDCDRTKLERHTLARDEQCRHGATFAGEPGERVQIVHTYTNGVKRSHVGVIVRVYDHFHYGRIVVYTREDGAECKVTAQRCTVMKPKVKAPRRRR